MSNDAVIQIRMDAKTKNKAVKFFKRYGLSTSDGVRLLIVQALRAKELPHVPNAATRRALMADVEPMADGDLAGQWGDE